MYASSEFCLCQACTGFTLPLFPGEIPPRVLWSVGKVERSGGRPSRAPKMHDLSPPPKPVTTTIHH